MHKESDFLLAFIGSIFYKVWKIFNHSKGLSLAKNNDLINLATKSKNLNKNVKKGYQIWNKGD